MMIIPRLGHFVLILFLNCFILMFLFGINHLNLKHLIKKLEGQGLEKNVNDII